MTAIEISHLAAGKSDNPRKQRTTAHLPAAAYSPPASSLIKTTFSVYPSCRLSFFVFSLQNDSPCFSNYLPHADMQNKSVLRTPWESINFRAQKLFRARSCASCRRLLSYGRRSFLYGRKIPCNPNLGGHGFF